MDKVKILVATHKPDEVYHDDVYMPIQVGKAVSRYDLGWQGDDTGDNISAKNPTFCELTALYWAWKNLKDVEYIGLCHYRRYFETKITAENIDEIMKGNDIILPTAMYHPTTLYHKFRSMTEEDCAIFFKVMEERFPDYYGTAVDYIMNNHKEYAFNMLISSQELFARIMEFLFGFLGECEKYIKLQPYTNGRRIYGYLSEYLLPIYCLKHQLQIKEMPVISMISEKKPRYVAKKCSLSVRTLCRLRAFLYAPFQAKEYPISQALETGLRHDGILDENGKLTIK